MNQFLYLDRNENLYGPAPACYDALRSISLNELSAYSRDFTRGVKSALSERLARNLGVPEPQILLSEGSEDMLKQIVHCYLGPGEKILSPAQSWWYYRQVASEVGGETITYPLKEGTDAFTYDVDEIIGRYQQESPRVVLIASPNNPTGNSFHDEDMNRLTEAFRESIVVLDEAYWGFGGQPGERIAELVRRYRNLVVLRTFSKFYALAGARIAFAAVGSSLTRLTRFAARYLGYNRISEELALAALNSGDYYLRMAEQMRKDRDAYYECFDALPGCKAFRSNANFVLLRIPREATESLNAFLRQREIAVKFFTEPEFVDCVRVTIGTMEQNERVRVAFREFFQRAT